MTTPDAGALFDGLAPGYDGDHFHESVAEALVRGLPATVSPRLVLDVATGTGAAAFAALRHLDARRLVGVDISPAMIERARGRAAVQDADGRIDWQVGQAVPAPMADDAVDIVLCASSLHFLGRAALHDWLRVLRQGGRVAFTLPPAETFRPSGAFAKLVATDLPLPQDNGQAAALATAAGFEQANATRLDITGERPRSVFLVHASAPSRTA
ncbi:Methyltransferase domain-containing protein [Amycolatopsis marina]|uniref:Methyltransferase domain-containing protein n=1 Tax=Amycolatopsis marina TaxID=490629 RepID=A0A1I1CHL6_9PSEU|nr:class I SAM-dependent methyltransferase [Amycolatopsis marina]SFB60398.1 Methyltransferase domain-containing protein [Amycolatopsis marina]